jgi:hypothetical protein
MLILANYRRGCVPKLGGVHINMYQTPRKGARQDRSAEAAS